LPGAVDGFAEELTTALPLRAADGSLLQKRGKAASGIVTGDQAPEGERNFGILFPPGDANATQGAGNGSGGRQSMV